MTPKSRKQPKRLEDLLEEDASSRTRGEKVRLGTMVLSGFISVLCAFILAFSWRAWDNISTLSADALLAKSERLAIVAQNKSDKELILERLNTLQSSLSENKRQNDLAITELRTANALMQKDVTALGVKVDNIITQQQRDNFPKVRP